MAHGGAEVSSRGDDATAAPSTWCRSDDVDGAPEAKIDGGTPRVRTRPYGDVASPSNRCQCLPTSFAVSSVSSRRHDSENCALPSVAFFRVMTQCSRHGRRSRGAGSSGHESTPRNAMSRSAYNSRRGGRGGCGRFRISGGGGGGASYLHTLPSLPSRSTTYHRLNFRRCCTTHSAETRLVGLRAASSTKSSSSWS